MMPPEFQLMMPGYTAKPLTRSTICRGVSGGGIPPVTGADYFMNRMYIPDPDRVQ